MRWDFSAQLRPDYFVVNSGFSEAELEFTTLRPTGARLLSCVLTYALDRLIERTIRA